MSETFLGQKLCHGVKSRLNRLRTFWEGFNEHFSNYTAIWYEIGEVDLALDAPGSSLSSALRVSAASTFECVLAQLISM